jgi:hypothetical protein
MKTTLDLAARLVPFPAEQRKALLARFPGGKGHTSQLADLLGRTWYLHRGDLVVDGGFESTLNLVVDGDLTVRGPLLDTSGEGLLVVTGDLLCRDLLSQQLLVVLGSVRSDGLVFAYYNDYAFEVWGSELEARAILIYDRSRTLPDKRKTSFEWDSDGSESPVDARTIFLDGFLRWEDQSAIPYRRVEENGKTVWLDEAGVKADAKTARVLAKAKAVPAEFEVFEQAIRSGEAVFRSPARAGLSAPHDWRIDPLTSAASVDGQAASTDVKMRVAAAGHPAASKPAVARLAKDPDARVRAAVVHHPLLTAAAATVLARDPNEDVRRQLAASVHATPLLAAFASDKAPLVRRATASHPNLDDSLRRKLIADPDRSVKARALRYQPVTAAWVAELRSSRDEMLAAWALEHEAEVVGKPSGRSDFRTGLVDARRAVREAALRAARNEPSLLPFLAENAERLVRDESPLIRTALASASRDGVILAALARDPDSTVRHFALENLAVPELVLLAEAERLAAAPAKSWSLMDPAYAEHITAVHALLRHPRLPASALRVIHRVFPRNWRLEPHRNMPLAILLDRAESLKASLAFEPEFARWKKAASDGKNNLGPLLARLLDSEETYLASGARISGDVPIAALLRHTRTISDQASALAEVASGARMGSAGKEADEIRRLLLGAGEDDVNRALAGNPDVPIGVLKELLPRAPEEARRTLWQVHGELR